jgi:uncharacterized protein YndB with AHSA1/START domain
MKSEVRISGNRLQITRTFDAPRQLVFGCWSQAEKLQQWSGCKEATECEIVMDFRVGGSFTQKMQIAVNPGGGTCVLPRKFRPRYHASNRRVLRARQGYKSGPHARRMPG